MRTVFLAHILCTQRYDSADSKWESDNCSQSLFQLTGGELVCLQVDTIQAQTKTSCGLAVPVRLSLRLCTIIFDTRKL